VRSDSIALPERGLTGWARYLLKVSHLLTLTCAGTV